MWAMEWNSTNNNSNLIYNESGRRDISLRLIFLFPKNFSSKSFNRSTLLPHIGWQPGFTAGLLKKCNTVPIVLKWNLGKQQPAMSSHAHNQPVVSDFDLISRDGAGLAENTERNLEPRQFLASDRPESRVF